MPRRADDCTMLCCACTEAEAAVVAAMKVAGGIDSDANLVRVALWSLADHMGLDMPNGVFDLRSHAFSPAARAARQAAGAKSRRRPNPKIRQHGRPQPKDHPWRQQEAASWAERTGADEGKS